MRGITLALAMGLLAVGGAAWSAPNTDTQPGAPTSRTPLPRDELAQISGGQAITIVNTNQTLTATNAAGGINANSVQTGAITFSSNALQGFNGIGNFVLNTGNNNTLQSSLSVTVVPAP